jgi:ribonuclease HII
VVAAAVILNLRHLPRGVDDSKRLSEVARERLYIEIMASAAVGIGIAGVGIIDRHNVLAASHIAMADAVRALPIRPALALVDGVHTPALDCPVEAIVGGDSRVLSIAAASIIAKVTRDRIMRELAETYPGYGFERHKGYGTSFHREAIERLGVTPHHRRSFVPIRVVVERSRPPGCRPAHDSEARE